MRGGQLRGRGASSAASLSGPISGAVAVLLAASLVLGASAQANPRSHHRKPARRARRSHHFAQRVAAARRGAGYSGSGPDYLNDSPHWLEQGSGHITFRTSRSGGRIVDFKGTLSLACEIGSTYVSARYLKVSRRGAFAYRFSFPMKALGGAVYGREYVAIYGRFRAHRSRASVAYLVDEVVKEKPVSNPFDTAHPQALGCASWVRGTVRAR